MEKSIGSMKTMGGTDDSFLNIADSLRLEDAPLGRIDRYELLRELGGGGFGVVYLARDTVAGIEVAAKGLPPLVKNNAEEMERIRENFALVSKLHHPNIAAALHLHVAKDVWYADDRVRQALRVLSGDTLLVMTFAPGVTLNKWRRQFPEGRVPVPQALEVCRQIAAALDYAHREKVVHRDVKPSNVMVETREKVRGNREEVIGDRGEVRGNREEVRGRTELCVRVLDFGLAAEIRSSMSRVSQEKGDTSGTRPYMAPEQWAGRRQDGRTDQYALAVLFYELVSGAVPFASAFDTGDPVIMASAAKTEPPDPLAALSKAQNAALLRGLAKEPSERFPDCTAFVEALGGRVTRLRDRGRADARPSPARRAALMMAAVAAIAASILSIRSIQSYRTRQAEARTVAAQDAAEQARLDDLQRRYESKAGERETNKRYAAASLAREKALKLERGQGVGAKLEKLEVTWREAEAARQSGGWGQALSGYDAVLASCEALEKEETLREAAKTRREESEKARQESEQAGSASDAKELFDTGGRASSRAAGLFEKGEFDEAGKAWREAADAYAAAKTRAEAVQAAAKPKLTVECNVPGARISDGQREVDAPHTFALKPDTRYQFVVSKESTESNQSIRSKRYKPATLEITADWKGPKTRRVELEEVRGPIAGEDWVSPATGMAFVWIPSLNIWVGKYEVTNGEYRKMKPSHDSKAYEGHSLNGYRQPVVCVNFDDAKEFARWLTQEDAGLLGGARYRVISESEWLACAQCGDGREYPWGNSMPPKYGNYSDSSSAWGFKIGGYTDGHAVTCAVEQSGRNEWGLYGMGGNVWECCASDSTGSSFGAWRGASWDYSNSNNLRCACRHDDDGSGRDNDYGFRVVLSR